MKMWPIAADLTSLAVTETGANLSDVTFSFEGGRQVTPMHTAPWQPEELPAELDEHLKILRGDFFCAPFGRSDVIPGETRGHGAPANGLWRLRAQTPNTLDLDLAGTVMGATISGHYQVKPGHRAVYQRHVISGGEGRIPMAHHAMLRAEPRLKLAFGHRIWAGTPEGIPERPPTGRSILAYPQDIATLGAARLADGGVIDLSVYPNDEGHEDLFMVVGDMNQPLGWTAATATDAGWVWFALKDPRVLPGTVLWLSNGGRTQTPWLSRHRHVVGIEEVRSYFASGHKTSIGDNRLTQLGIPTAFDLTPAGRIVINYIFGLAPAPVGFGQVADIRAEGDGIRITDIDGTAIHAAVDLTFLSALA